RVVTQDGGAALGIDLGACRVAFARRAFDHLTDMHDQPADRAACVLYFDLPAIAANDAGVADLPAAFDIERRVAEHDLDLIARHRAFHAPDIDDQRQHAVLVRQITLRHVFDAALALLALVLQSFEDLRVEFDRFEFAHGLAAAADERVFVLGAMEARFVHGCAALFGDVPDDLERQAERRLQVERPVAGQDALTALRQFVEHGVQFVQAAVERAPEVLL